MPAFTLCLAAAVFFTKFKNLKIIQNMMVGVRPACLAMVCGVCITLSMTNYAENNVISLPSILIGVLDAFLLIKCKISIPKVILLSAALGILFYGIVPVML